MLKQMQLQVYRQRESFVNTNPDLGGGKTLSPSQRFILSRIAQQQATITQVFERFKRSLGAP
jgi:hypothetical protein